MDVSSISSFHVILMKTFRCLLQYAMNHANNFFATHFITLAFKSLRLSSNDFYTTFTDSAINTILNYLVFHSYISLLQRRGGY